MKKVICTISTHDYLPKVEALYHSLMDKGTVDYDFYVLLIEEKEWESTLNNAVIISLKELEKSKPSPLYKKYRGDKLRWALKSVFLQYLIQKGFGQLIYVDNDIFFFDHPEVIFDKLKNADFLLTPHFYQSFPHSNQRWFEANFRVGLYNAGFIACTSHAQEHLAWWEEACIYNIKKNPNRGLFDDQKYLDMLPILFDGVAIIKDRAWNLAAWNDSDFDQAIPFDVKNEHPVFIHFTNLALEKWKNTSHKYHKFYKEYLASLKTRKFTNTKSRKKHIIAEYFNYLLWKLQRLREK